MSQKVKEARRALEQARIQWGQMYSLHQKGKATEDQVTEAQKAVDEAQKALDRIAWQGEMA